MKYPTIGKHRPMIGLLKILRTGERKTQTDSSTELRKRKMETTKCKHCNCNCHCSLKEHGDMYGLCTCLVCEHELEECETCQ